MNVGWFAGGLSRKVTLKSNAVLLPLVIGITKPTDSTALTVVHYNEFRKATRSPISFAVSPIWKRWL